MRGGEQGGAGLPSSRAVERQHHSLHCSIFLFFIFSLG